MTTLAWVTDPHLPDNKIQLDKIQDLLSQHRVLSSSVVALDLGNHLYQYTIDGDTTRLQELIAPIYYPQVSIVIPTDSLRYPDYPERGVQGNPPTQADIIGGMQTIVHIFTERLLSTTLYDVVISEEIGYTIFTPMLSDEYGIFRSPDEIQSFMQRLPLDSLIGWTAIDGDNVTIQLARDNPSVKMVSGILVTRVGQEYDEMAMLLEERARALRAEGYIPLTSTLNDRFDFPHTDDGTWITMDVGYNSTEWTLDNQHREYPLLITGTPTPLPDETHRVKMLAAAKRAYLQAHGATSQYHRVVALENSTILYPSANIDFTTNFTRELNALTTQLDEWTVTAVPSLAVGVARRLHLHEMGIISLLVSNRKPSSPLPEGEWWLVSFAEEPEIEIPDQELVERYLTIYPDRCGDTPDDKLRLLAAGDCRPWTEITDEQVAYLEGAF